MKPRNRTTWSREIGVMLARSFLIRFSVLLLSSLTIPLFFSITAANADTGQETEVIALPKPVLEGSVSLERALARRRSVRDFGPEPISLAAVSQLLWAAQGVTSDRGYRTAPSAGALYPLRVHLVAGAVSGAAAGVYRYEPDRHRLERIASGDLRKALARASYGQGWMADAPAIIVFAADDTRTIRKYGKRATRYVQMEVGHAAQNVYLQAESLGLGTCMVGAFSDRSVKKVLDLPAALESLGLMPVGSAR